MTTYVLIHGAGSDGWYWHLVTPILQEHGHEVVAPDLPVDDDRAGLAEYTDVVVDAIGDRTDLVVVAQSLAGFVGPLVCDRRLDRTRQLILVAAMTPKPGEPPGEWWTNTGWDKVHPAMGPGFDPMVEFFHDVPPDITSQAFARGARDQSGTPFEKPWPLAAWPDVPTRFILGRHDRFFPADFQRRVVGERLGVTPEEIDSGHLPALARPAELAALLLREGTAGTP